MNNLVKLVVGLVIVSFLFSFTNNGEVGKLCRRWKIDQFYADSMRIYDLKLDLIRFEFKHNGKVKYGLKGNEETINWRFENNKKLLVLYYDTVLIDRYKIEHLSPQCLIFTINRTDSASNRQVFTEYRLSSIPPNQ